MSFSGNKIQCSIALPGFVSITYRIQKFRLADPSQTGNGILTQQVCKIMVIISDFKLFYARVM